MRYLVVPGALRSLAPGGYAADADYGNLAEQLNDPPNVLAALRRRRRHAATNGLSQTARRGRGRSPAFAKRFACA